MTPENGSKKLARSPGNSGGCPQVFSPSPRIEHERRMIKRHVSDQETTKHINVALPLEHRKSKRFQTVKYWHDGRKCCPANPVFFKRLIEQHPYSNFDLDASYPKRGLSFRTVSLWIEEKHSRITLLTTLERRRFSAEKIGEIYRLRWQVEILFKEMKSHAGLGKWLTRKASLVRATIWSSVIATLLKRYLSHSSVRGGVGCSTLRCAEVLRTEMPLLLDVIGRRKALRQPLRRLMDYLARYGVRAHRARDQENGRYSYVLAPVS